MKSLCEVTQAQDYIQDKEVKEVTQRSYSGSRCGKDGKEVTQAQDYIQSKEVNGDQDNGDYIQM